MMKQKLLISACFCGKNTKYSGGNNQLPTLEKLEQIFELVLICPEVMGGLSTPRDPSEILGNGVVSNKGRDVTKEFQLGAKQALEKALETDVKIALLKESSPSCGVNWIYDGSFQGVKKAGMGVTAKLLKQHHIELYTENDIDKLIEKYS